MRVFVYVFFLMIVVSCHKAQEHQPLSLSPVGSWHPEDAPDGRALIFQPNGDLVYKQWDTLLTYAFTRYRIENDSTLTFFGAGARQVTFHIDGQALRLEGACVNTCDELLYRIGSL